MNADAHKSQNDVISLSTQAVSCEIGGETVILDLASGQYFALNPIGTQIWQWLSEPSTAESICERLLAEYDVDPGECRAQVNQLLGQLAGHGLVSRAVPETTATALVD